MRTRDSSSSSSSSSSSASRETDDETTSADDDNYDDDDDMDLFYDATLDAKDEKRVRGKKKKKKKNNDAIEAETDAILSCPKCLSTVCAQCQRHEKFDLQFRAVESFGTTVDEEFFIDDNGSFRGRKVRCEACEETVGLLDEEDVYHFFNVVPSN